MNGYVFVDWPGVENAIARSVSAAELARMADVNPRTAARAINGKRMQRASALEVVSATGVENPEIYLISTDQGATLGKAVAQDDYGNWEIQEDALEYRLLRDVPFWIGKAKNKLDGRIGRLKRYQLGKQFNDEDFETAKSELGRHPTICGRMERHPNFPLYYDSKFNGMNCFWLVEKWESDITLKQLVESDGFCDSMIPNIGLELAKAMNDLNKAGVVRRELNPRTILIRENDRSPLLVDFETATFAFNTHSRKIEWTRDPFLAREVDSPDVDVRADLFSWGQVMIYCLTRKQPKSFYEPKFFASLAAPKNVIAALDACTQDNRDWRRLEKKSEKEVSDFESLFNLIDGWS